MVTEMNALARAFGMPAVEPFASARSGEAGHLLALDVRETGAAIEVAADVPGIKAEDLKISVGPDNVLTLSGERRSEVKEGSAEGGSLRIERSFGAFTRRLRLPDTANVDGIKARLKDGELRLTIPKVKAKVPEPKTIKVETEMPAAPEPVAGEAAPPAAEEAAPAAGVAPEAAAEGDATQA
eukprot:scaffold2.g7362.t1